MAYTTYDGAVTSSSPEVATRATRGVEPPTASGAPVESDLGWALGVVFRRYAKAAAAALDDVPGGPLGYQVLATANSEGPRRQLDLGERRFEERVVNAVGHRDDVT